MEIDSKPESSIEKLENLKFMKETSSGQHPGTSALHLFGSPSETKSGGNGESSNTDGKLPKLYKPDKL